MRSYVSSLVSWCRLWAATFREVLPTLAWFAAAFVVSGVALVAFVGLPRGVLK